ncbi:MAG: ABC transporter ATP-binding protein [Bdellovibrionales bacterium RIFCSPHIGHO2_01_FULL_40_29]|nr:MAG: ABC transporter ATP-binding protein [Bdellovibrionales bacterium RIFCSPHIGHO2_01_FULL_40_29]OFZ34135.1 MAG: ABC transporter ATP-binding protein [Bdellovibrionales bacterium RIFCSPHIGHO2_02_FULL_40_15]
MDNLTRNKSEFAVELTQLKKSFDGKEFILKGIDLKIPRGSLTAIIGFSGTGKSVLLKHMLGLFRPTSGSVKILGTDLSTLDDNALTLFRCNYGVLFQSAALFDDMTVLENVCFPLEEHRRDLKKDQVLEIAEKKLSGVNLEPKHFGKLPNQISGGMQKRTGLARALALDPEILLYDEPTTGLDPILTEMVDDLIVSTHRARPGTTSIMVSHDLYAAFRIADFVVMLDAGRVLLSGTADDFYKTDIELVRKFVDKGIKHQ